MKKAHSALADLWPALERGEPEAVHEARKLTRKVGAQLRLVDAPKKVRRAWRDLRRAVAPVRDRDATLAHLLDALEDEGAPEGEIERFEAAWREERDRLWAATRLPDPPPAVELEKGWKTKARQSLARDWRRLVRDAAEVIGDADGGPEAAGEPVDDEAWHTLRKDLKRYRHTLDLLEKPPAPLTDLLQALGRLQDAAVARELLAHADLPPERRDALLARETRAAGDARVRAAGLWRALRDAPPHESS